jgi:hypothetical protein
VQAAIGRTHSKKEQAGKGGKRQLAGHTRKRTGREGGQAAISRTHSKKNRSGRGQAADSGTSTSHTERAPADSLNIYSWALVISTSGGALGVTYVSPANCRLPPLPACSLLVSPASCRLPPLPACSLLVSPANCRLPPFPACSLLVSRANRNFRSEVPSNDAAVINAGVGVGH